MKLLSHVQLCDLMDCSLPGSSIHGISQARVLEWVAISFIQAIFLTQGPDPGTKPRSPTLQANALLSKPPGKPKWAVGKLLRNIQHTFKRSYKWGN